jgi:MFS family permease
MSRRIARVIADLRGLPRQFWLLALGTFVFLIGIDMCFPFETLYLTQRLDISMTTIGLIIGVMSFVGVPFQIPGGALADRLGRRPLIMVGIVGTMTLYLGIAFAPSLWVIVLAFGIEAVFGWSMFLTGSNAMIADLIPFHRRAEAYSLTRTAVSLGASIGPLLASWILGATGSFRLSFVVGTAICAVFLLMVILFFKETRPRPGADPAEPASGVGSVAADTDTGVRPADADAAAVARHGDAAAARSGPGATDGRPEDGSAVAEPAAPMAPQPAPPVEEVLPGPRRGGYARVLRDRRFLLFLGAALLPTYCFAQIWVTLPVLLNDLHGTSPQTWGLLLALYSVTSAIIQFPLVRSLRRRDTVRLIGLGSLLIGCALGGFALAPYGWLTVLLMIVLATGVVLFMPLVPAVVSHMAPADLRGRYMGVWTLIYVGGYGLGPLFGGWAFDALGPRGAYLVALAVGMCGGLLFFLLAAAGTPSASPDPGPG